MGYTYKNLPSKIVLKSHNGLRNLNRNETLYIKQKWESERHLELSEDDWRSKCLSQHNSTSSRQWREYGWKNVIRFFITPYIKSKQLKTPQQCWRLCGDWDANHSHVFWKCKNIRSHWESIAVTMKKVFGYDVPCEARVLYFGLLENVRKEDYLFKIMLLTSKRNWLKSDPLKLEERTDVIEEIYIMEKMTDSLRLKSDKFQKHWTKWIAYKTHSTP